MYAITGNAIFPSYRSIPDYHRHACPRFRCRSTVFEVGTLKFNNQSTSANESIGKGGGGDEEKTRLSGIHVPRERYISVRKGELLDGIVSSLFESKEEADEFQRFSRCLDSILQAEHKVLLEELRLNYSLAHLPDEKGNNHQEAASKGLELTWKGLTWKMGINGHGLSKDVGRLEYNKENKMSLSGEYADSGSADFGRTSRLDNAANFQRTFMKLLEDAKFEEMSANDLMLARTLETDYLLTLPIHVDWKKALESNAIIFRRGYATERQNGLLIVEKLDYLQSKLLQETFFLLSKTLNGIIKLISKAIKYSKEEEGTNVWFQRAKVWLMEQSFPQTIHPYSEERYNSQVDDIKIANKALPIWLAAQRAAPLYEGLLSSIGPRGRLMRRLLSWIGLIPSTPETLLELNKENKHSETHLSRPNFLPRVTISDIWRPATKEYCENFWEMFKAGVSILFTKSFLQEPAFHELILLYTDDTSQRESLSKTEALPLHLKIYEGIPIPDLPVIFPNRKLSFRILDTIRLDIASILGLLAYFVNYKFETIISSPSAFLLDVVAISALILYATRVVLGYKTTWDRYQLLVNKTLYEKTLASGFGSVHFLLDASEQQQYKEAILAYALLLHPEKYQMQNCRDSVKDACERFIFDKFAEKVEMPVDSALKTLQRLGIVNEVSYKETPELEALPCSRACDLLKEQWKELLEKKIGGD